MLRLRRGLRRTPTVLGVVASLIAIGGVAIAVYRALNSGESRPSLPEHGQIVAFRQVANRICTENHQAMQRAFPAARSYSELLAYLSRATRWGIGDLLSVTPPPRSTVAFAEEIENRKIVAGDLLDLQRNHETGDTVAQARVRLDIADAEARAEKLNRILGLVRCAPVLPRRWQRPAG